MGETIVCIASAVFAAALNIGFPLWVSRQIGQIMRGEWDSPGKRAFKAQSEAHAQWRDIDVEARVVPDELRRLA